MAFNQPAQQLNVTGRHPVVQNLNRCLPFPFIDPFAGMDGLELCALSGPNAHEVVSPLDLLGQQDLISVPGRTVNDRFVAARIAP
jgi:hypothetical protein